jgi:uroporphyrinogen decarboxylase
MAEMTNRQRIKAAIAGEKVDRMPVAFWRHWPIDDQEARSLARVALDFYTRYDFDFIKIPPSSSYCVDDYGLKHEFRGKLIGERDFLERPVKNPADWDQIKPLDIHKGTYGKQLECLRLVLAQKDPNTPVIHTMFNPLAMATRLSGDEACFVELRRNPKRMERVLAALTETCESFARTVIEEGADGIFLSTGAASYEIMSEEEYHHFGRPYDLEVLKAAEKGWFNVLHLHGQYPMFAQLADYPVQVINWHDRTAGPSLAEAGKMFSGALAGGVDQYGVLQCGTGAEVEAQIHDAIKQTNGRKLIVAAGCTFPVTVADGNLIAARHAVDTAPEL